MAFKAPVTTRQAATRRNLLESLENRQLMAVTTANFNFQPAGTSTPSGFIADTGKAYTTQNGQQYGWNTNNTAATRDRKTAASTEMDTLAHFGKSGMANKWEVAVPNGTYAVTVTAGDAVYTDSRYGIAVEGTTIVSKTPTSGSKFATASGTVKVSDGRLTVTGTSGSFNNKIVSLKFKPGTATTGGATGAGIKAPAVTAWVDADAAGSNAAVVSWADVANETGYIIEKSTTGGTGSYSQAARVGANVTSYRITGLSANTNYTFRVKAFNSVGTSAASVYQTIRTAASTNTNTNTGGGGGISIPTGHTLSGVSVNGGDVGEFKGALNDMGIKNVRLWLNVDWNSNPAGGWYAQRAAAYKAAGFKVMMVVIHENPTSYSNAKAFYNRLANDAGLRNTVDYWQIGNEPNHHNFWTGSLSSYVNTHLKPAYEALKAKGETVVGAGPTGNVGAARELESYGYSKYVDYSAYHAYGDTAATILRDAAAAKAAFNNKPIMFTEWNITGKSGNKAAWVSELNKAAPGLSKIGALSYYFGMEVSNTHVGGGGLLNTNGTRNGGFYSSMKDWLN